MSVTCEKSIMNKVNVIRMVPNKTWSCWWWIEDEEEYHEDDIDDENTDNDDINDDWIDDYVIGDNLDGICVSSWCDGKYEDICGWMELGHFHLHVGHYSGHLDPKLEHFCAKISL